MGDRDLRSVFVTNLPIKADERDIREFFEKTGAKVRDVRLVRDRFTNKSKGYLILFSLIMHLLSARPILVRECP